MHKKWTRSVVIICGCETGAEELVETHAVAESQNISEYCCNVWMELVCVGDRTILRTMDAGAARF